MPSYSSEESRKDWVYAVARDFKAEDGTPATWADGHPRYWGDEDFKIPLDTSPNAACANADNTLLAVAVKHDINVYDLKDLSLQQVLQGHVSQVDAMEFHPKEPNTLVSRAMENHGMAGDAEPTIIIWDLEAQRSRKLESESTMELARNQAVAGVLSALHDSASSWVLNEEEKGTLADDVSTAIRKLNIQSQARANTKIHGRLVQSFGSQIFNADGSKMILLPGGRPKSNAVDKWDICIWDTIKQQICLTLEGHTDAIMWVGFSPNLKLIASVSWDKTFRIWDHGSGNLLRTFTSEGQNWVGGFSADSRLFAGTSGPGRVYVWNMEDGSEVLAFEAGIESRWYRTLNWRPDGKQLVIGGQEGQVLVLDVASNAVVQERLLSPGQSAETLKGMWGHGVFTEVGMARYLANGRSIIYHTSGDQSVEIYNFVKNRKWRYAPHNEQSSWIRVGCQDTVVLEGIGMIASMGPDAVRIWSMPELE